MEMIIGAILGIAVVIGGLVGFLSLFTSGDKESRVRHLERELATIKSRLQAVEAETQRQTQAAMAKEKPRVDEVVIAVPDDEPLEEETDTLDEHASFETTTENEAASTVQALADGAEETVHYSQRLASKPIAPNIIEKAVSFAKDWLLGGNTLVRSGIVILFIGISFLLKYVAQHSNIPIEFRLTGVALFGVALLAFGWRQRNARQEYSWALQGGGIGVLYLTTFAAMKLYQLIPPSAAFALLAVIAFLSASIAILQSALPLAILGFVGGFLAPIFTSSGSGSHIGLFSYYFVLNLAIAFIAYHKSWRALNVIGFAFTFIIGTLWGAKNYQPAYFLSTEPFLVGHFLLFTLIAILYARRQATKATDYVDATLVFGTPLVGFGLQYALLRDSEFGLAYSALALAAFYILLARWILTRKRETMQFLGECFLALGIGFATLSIPLALDGRWTSAAWAVEGVGLLWVGLRQRRQFPMIAGLLLQLLGAAAFVFGWGLTEGVSTVHQNMFLGVAFIALSAWACGALLNHYRDHKLGWCTQLLAIWGWLWWVAAGLTAVDAFLPDRYFAHASLAFVALSSAALPLLSKRIKWPFLAKLSVLLLPVMALCALGTQTISHPFKDYGFFSWAIAFAVYLYLLFKQEIIKGALFRAPLLWIATIVLSDEWVYQLRHIALDSSVWQAIGWAVVPMLMIGGMTYWQASTHKKQTRTWLWVACAPLVVLLIVWFIKMSLYSDGQAAPLTYIPVLNPLDITLIGVILMLLIWSRQLLKTLEHAKIQQYLPAVTGLMGFSLLNGMLLRTLHHWAGTPFQWTAMFDYPIVQMSFTFMWAITAFILMLLAHKKTLRILWMVGAGLMALVVAKMFLLDLAQTGTVERIASFIGAGIMLLVMGYFAPLPPASTTEQETESGPTT